MKNVKKTIEVSFDKDEFIQELVQAVESFACEALSDADPESIKSRMEDYLDGVQEELQMEVDNFLENECELEVNDYLNNANDGVTTTATFDETNYTINVEVDADVEPRMKETDFNRLLSLVNELGLNMADKTAILKIAKDAGVE